MNINSAVIRKEMAQQEIRIKDLSEKTGISKQSISTILTRGTCQERNAGKIAKALNVSVDTIFTVDKG